MNRIYLTRQDRREIASLSHTSINMTLTVAERQQLSRLSPGLRHKLIATLKRKRRTSGKIDLMHLLSEMQEHLEFVLDGCIKMEGVIPQNMYKKYEDLRKMINPIQQPVVQARKAIESFSQNLAPEAKYGSYGFRNTVIKPENFAKILKLIGAQETPVIKKGWSWRGSKGLIVTSENPFTGENYRERVPRSDRVGKIEYVGIEGPVVIVDKIVALWKQYGTFEDESPGARDFI